ncbi:hypothetical protein VSU01S_11700 [Vibrio superstes NBRC 103154]|uniref:Uncharacterized protein n=1 Tax=Vibrio superstes NBRC 103154 TaxID=1219062 RepID=A0A511QNK7_9VIBR|nr:hypothetical protein VSU01S_11700 [Vibrio superstes NBRC 103154]
MFKVSITVFTEPNTGLIMQFKAIKNSKYAASLAALLQKELYFPQDVANKISKSMDHVGLKRFLKSTFSGKWGPYDHSAVVLTKRLEERDMDRFELIQIEFALAKLIDSNVLRDDISDWASYECFCFSKDMSPSHGM